MKAESVDIELIEPTRPGNNWQSRPLNPASLNLPTFEGDTIPSLQEMAEKLGNREMKGSTKKTDGGAATNLEPETTLGLLFRVWRKG